MSTSASTHLTETERRDLHAFARCAREVPDGSQCLGQAVAVHRRDAHTWEPTCLDHAEDHLVPVDELLGEVIARDRALHQTKEPV